MMLTWIAFVVAAPVWMVENPNADIATEQFDGENAIRVTTYDGEGSGVSVLSEMPADPYRGKKLRLSARLRMDAKESEGAAYMVVRTPEKTLVFHAETHTSLQSGWVDVAVVAEIPSNATVVALAFWQHDENFSATPRPGLAGRKQISSWFRAISLQESDGDPVSKRADFLPRASSEIGSHVTRQSWMRSDDSRVVSDGAATSFLVAALTDVQLSRAAQNSTLGRRR